MFSSVFIFLAYIKMYFYNNSCKNSKLKSMPYIFISRFVYLRLRKNLRIYAILLYIQINGAIKKKTVVK